MQTTGAAVLKRKVKLDFVNLMAITNKTVELRWIGIGCARPTDRGRGPDLCAKEPKSSFKPITLIMRDRSAHDHVAVVEIEISQTGWVGLTPCG